MCFISISGYIYKLNYYHWVDTSIGGLLVPEGIISPVVKCFYHWVNTSIGGLLVSEGIISPVVKCFYHWVNTSIGGLLVSECIISPVVNVSVLTWFIIQMYIHVYLLLKFTVP